MRSFAPTIFGILCFINGMAGKADQLVGAISRDGMEVLRKAQEGLGTVRQCSCEEQRECVDEMKRQAKECNRPCFQKFEKVTTKIDDLMQCFDKKNDIVEGFLGCFETQVDGCVNTKMGSQIPKTNISVLFTLGEKKLEKKDPTLDALLSPIRHILDSAAEWALCLKNCFLDRNKHGFCFDRKECQPKVDAHKAQRSFAKCTHKIRWKQEAGDLCHCSANAGLEELRQYCTLFDHMKNHRNTTRVIRH